MVLSKMRWVSTFIVFLVMATGTYAQPTPSNDVLDPENLNLFPDLLLVPTTQPSQDITTKEPSVQLIPLSETDQTTIKKTPPTPEPFGLIGSKTSDQTTVTKTVNSILFTNHSPDLFKTSLRILRHEISRLLQSYGNMNDDDRILAIDRINRLSDRCTEMADTLPDYMSRLEAIMVALQTHNTMALQAKDLPEAENQMSKLQAAAWKAKRMAGGAPDAIAEFWLLNSDLFDITRAEINIDDQQQHAIERFERFIDEQTSLGLQETRQVNPIHWAVVDSVKLALLRIYDQRGMSNKVSQLVKNVRSSLHRKDLIQRAYLDHMYGYCSMLGYQFEAQLMTDNDTLWTSQAHQGMYVLIHFWADWAPQSVDAFNTLHDRYTELVNHNVTLLSVCLDGSAKTQPDKLNIDWATCSEQSDTQNLGELFSVNSLPRFALIDQNGCVMAIGGSLGILAQTERWEPVASTDPNHGNGETQD